MWNEFARIIRETLPKWILIENVSRLLQIPEYDQILSDLETAGYEYTTYVLHAKDFGAPHNRPRCIIVAHTLRDGLQETDNSTIRHQSTLTRFTGLCCDVGSRNTKTTNPDIFAGLQADKTTHTQRENKGGGGSHGIMLNGRLGQLYPSLIGKRIHPEFVEWMMGFPAGWTDKDCRQSATQLCRNVSFRSSQESERLKEENHK